MSISLREIIVGRIKNQKGIAQNMVVHGPQTNSKQWGEAVARVQAGFDSMLRIAEGMSDEDYKSSKRGKKEEEKPAEKPAKEKGKGKKATTTPKLRHAVQPTAEEPKTDATDENQAPANESTGTAEGTTS
jgi:hypothetical protein